MSLEKKIRNLGARLIERLEKDELTPLERCRRISRYEEADRITGSFAFWNPAVIGVSDISLEEYYTNPEKMYYCQLVAMETFQHDYPLLFADNYNTEPEALGAKIVFAGDDTPVLVAPAIQKKEELYGLAIPDPFTQGRLPYRIEICRIHNEVLGEYFPISTPINAPFSMAVGIRGYESLVMDMVEDPDFVHALMEFCTEVTITFGRAIKSVCGSYPSLVDAWSSIPHLSPGMFLEFSFPYAARCVQVFERCGWGFGGGHQFSENWKKSLRMILASGTKSFTLFEENITGIRGGKIVDMAGVKEICKNKGASLCTTLHPDTMLLGPPGRIESLMSAWIKQVSPGGGHMLYTSVLTGTPPDHIRSFVEVIKRSTFPIS